jgi:hypothetical protein
MASHSYDQESGEPRWYGVYAGTVVACVDPEKRGRVQVLIPGLCEPHTNWALPAGGSHTSGESGRGGFDPPAKGAAVYVMFLCGDIDEPVYLGGWRGLVGGKTDAPTEVQGASPADAATKLKVYETESFLAVIDERSSSKALSLRAKTGMKIDIFPNRVEINAGGTILRVKDGKIQFGGDAAEAVVLGTSWWRAENGSLSQQITALQSEMMASIMGPTAPLVPGLAMQIAALQALQAAGAAEAFLSKLSFTEK